jgi:Cation efflux family
MVRVTERKLHSLKGNARTPSFAMREPSVQCDRLAACTAVARNYRATPEIGEGCGMTGNSKVAVYAALAANLAIAATKFGAFLFTSSTAMLTEAIHSTVDTGNEALLLFGLDRAARPPDETHPFGHGMEIYFWSFIVALLIFTAGGAVANLRRRCENPGAGTASERLGKLSRLGSCRGV